MGNDILMAIAKAMPSTDPNKVYSEAMKYLPKNGNLVDIGCCGGTVGLRFVNDYKLTGVDFNQAYLDKAIESGYSKGVLADVTKPLPFENNSFEVVLATEIIEHMPNDKLEFMVSELHRISNGYIVTTVPNCENKFQKILHEHWFDRYTTQQEMGVHHQRFTPSSFEETLENAGFNVLSSKKILLGTDLLVVAEA